MSDCKLILQCEMSRTKFGVEVEGFEVKLGHMTSLGSPLL